MGMVGKRWFCGSKLKGMLVCVGYDAEWEENGERFLERVKIKRHSKHDHYWKQAISSISCNKNAYTS
ncbi:hypothetical protein RIF29_23759 [Crotalaria pallida]|uniref:Uncharacterized protein n=1 Tax=Crotalaria pallida TaxID=3830 RepID=A0AAN9FAQ1_CROPI